MSGKGDRRRPTDPQKFSDGYDRIFKQKKLKQGNKRKVLQGK